MFHGLAKVGLVDFLSLLSEYFGDLVSDSLAPQSEHLLRKKTAIGFGQILERLHRGAGHSLGEDPLDVFLRRNSVERAYELASPAAQIARLRKEIAGGRSGPTAVDSMARATVHAIQLRGRCGRFVRQIRRGVLRTAVRPSQGYPHSRVVDIRSWRTTARHRAASCGVRA